MDSKLKGEFFKIQSKNWGRCFFPGEAICSSKPIRAHSIQNAGVLESLAESGHVVMIEAPFENGVPVPTFREVGRNKATTFAGLCQPHDTELFRPIDTQPIDLNNELHLLLLAYRSILREMIGAGNRAVKFQRSYEALVKRGHLDPEKESEPGNSATVAMAEAWGFFRHMCRYGEAYSNNKPSQIHHHVIRLAGPPPGFACSGVYAIIDNFAIPGGIRDYHCAALNVFPHEGGSAAVISYPASHADHWAAHVAELIEATGHYQKYLLTKLVLRHCENFVVRPSYFQAMGEQKQAEVLRYWCTNLFGEKHDYDNEHLFLF